MDTPRKCSIKDDHEGSNAERLTRGVEYTTLQAVETDSEPGSSLVNGLD